MQGRVIEISGNGHFLGLERGFLTVTGPHPETGERTELGRIPLDQLAAVLVTGNRASLSTALADRLCSMAVPVVICGERFLPSSMIWPVAGHHLFAERIQAQAALPARTAAALWRQTVQAKLNAQADCLDLMHGSGGEALRAMARRVRAGDSGNLEAQGARRYWPALIGSSFRRDRQSGNANALLNYGYAVIRAAMARAIMTAGLHPAFGLQHRQARNPMALADDLMEPWRPLVDRLAVEIDQQSGTPDAPDTKAAFARLVTQDVHMPDSISPVMQSMLTCTRSLVAVMGKEQKQLEFPKSLFSVIDNSDYDDSG